MAESSERTPWTGPRMAGVLCFTFGPPRSYAATSYPHQVVDSNEKELNISRDIAISTSMPRSLQSAVKEGTHKTLASADETVNLYALTPGRYFMRILCWPPDDLEKGDENWIPFDKNREAIWHIYSWHETMRCEHRFRPDHDPSDGTRHLHPVLGKYLTSIKRNRGGGSISDLSLGETSSNFFIRLTDTDRTWYYRHHGLPENCNLAIQEATSASPPPPLPPPSKNSKGEVVEESDVVTAMRKQRVWKHGALRGVTLGQGDGWIMYRDNEHVVAYNDTHFPKELREALERGMHEEWTINQVVLNPHHALEYMLAFNNGRVFCSFHHRFGEDFERIARQWAEAKDDVKSFEFHFKALRDHQYPHKLNRRNSDIKANGPAPRRATFDTHNLRHARHQSGPPMPGSTAVGWPNGDDAGDGGSQLERHQSHPPPQHIQGGELPAQHLEELCQELAAENARLKTERSLERARGSPLYEMPTVNGAAGMSSQGPVQDDTPTLTEASAKKESKLRRFVRKFE